MCLFFDSVLLVVDCALFDTAVFDKQCYIIILQLSFLYNFTGEN